MIEQGESSLYLTLLQQLSSVEVLRIVASIGGPEVDHFSPWHDGHPLAAPPAARRPRYDSGSTLHRAAVDAAAALPFSLPRARRP